MPNTHRSFVKQSFIQRSIGRPVVWLATGAAVLMASMLHLAAAGSVALTTLDAPYAQNFDSLADTGTLSREGGAREPRRSGER